MEKNKWEGADKEGVGLYNWDEERVCAEKREDVSIVERRERRDAQVHWRTIEERVYQTFEVTSNNTCVFCKKEEW